MAIQVSHRQLYALDTRMMGPSDPPRLDPPVFGPLVRYRQGFLPDAAAVLVGEELR